MIRLTVNGEERSLAETRLDRALEALLPQAPARGTAVALNGRLVPRSQWAETEIAAGDALEIVRAVGGG